MIPTFQELNYICKDVNKDPNKTTFTVSGDWDANISLGGLSFNIAGIVLYSGIISGEQYEQSLCGTYSLISRTTINQIIVHINV